METKILSATDYILNVGGADVTGYNGKAFKVPSATAKVLAVVNPSDKFKAACAVSASWSVINSVVEDVYKRQALLKEVYPQLRLVEYTVSYTVVPFSVEQGREIIHTCPDKMNHYEMFQVADSYGKGSDEYNKIIRMIADRFPDDRIANNNALSLIHILLFRMQ